MRSGFNPAQIFAFEIIVVVLSFYFIYLQLRRLRYRRIAAELGAEYESQGLFKTGEIAGSNNGRKYRIRTREIAVYRSASTWTTFSMDCLNKGIPLSLQGRFFKPFPNWKFAFTRGDRRERVFVADVTIQNVPVPLEEKYHSQVQRLFREIALADSGLLRKGSSRIEIEQDSLSYTMHGVLKNNAAARQIISLLAEVADRIESAPVS